MKSTFLLLLMLRLCSTDDNDSPTQRRLVRRTTQLLNNILQGYDKNLRPTDENGLTRINISILVKSMGPVSDMNMAYSMDVYFRQQWRDERLRFSGSFKLLTLSINMLEDIWKPDTYFFNGKDSYMHTITQPNKLLRIDQDGVVLYSMRLTLKASCPLYLNNFPMDNQTCYLYIGSYAFMHQDLKYSWTGGANSKTALDFDKGVTLSQFQLKAWLTGEDQVATTHGIHSVLTINFYLYRHMGYYLLQVYVPAILVVFLSWLSFFLNREATGDRVSLGVTCVLTLAAMSMDTRSSIPKVSYATALDYFVIICFLYVNGAMVQFSAVHYFTKRNFGDFPHDEDSEEEDVEIIPEECQGCMDMITKRKSRTPTEVVLANGIGTPQVQTKIDAMYDYEEWKCAYYENCENLKKQRKEEKKEKKDSLWLQAFRCIIWDEGYRHKKIATAKDNGDQNSVSKIDLFSRVMFPLTFGILNLIYWYSYMKSVEIPLTAVKTSR